MPKIKEVHFGDHVWCIGDKVDGYTVNAINYVYVEAETPRYEIYYEYHGYGESTPPPERIVCVPFEHAWSVWERDITHDEVMEAIKEFENAATVTT